MTTDDNWWPEFFSGLCLDFIKYSRDELETELEADFIESSLGLDRHSSILDIPCGGGRLSSVLATRGYNMTGLDFGEKLIKHASDSAPVSQGTINWVCHDMRDIQFPDKFDGAFCWWNSFGYFDDVTNAKVLKAISKSLKPGAQFILDTPLVETRVPEIESQDKEWWQVGDLIILEERRFDYPNSRVESDWTFIRDGLVETKHLSLRLYTFKEISELLYSAGFGSHKAFGSIDFELFGRGSSWLYMVTTKL